MNEHRPVAIVTGASRGIGAAIVAVLREHDWSVVGADLEPSESLRDENVRMIEGDVTDEQLWDRLVDAAQELGELRGIVNNAGVQGPGARLAETSLADFAANITINTHGAFLGTRAGLRSLRSGGSIVNIASNAGFRGVPRYGPYVAAKHAVVGLTRSAAIEGARDGIRVNAVAPGPTQTRIMDAVADSFNAASPAAAREKLTAANPSRRFAEPAEVAEAVMWLLGEKSGYVTGTVMPVDGGLTAL
ncbi:SDR family NAD(P)-dependent oxidoreductase [Planosporangium sp. 12N6]|uniref:SDR family NAD(P)-dependent oxidoreductase n=1 Tax=Planosporangium spinosum TaxID=3402278 RepID=UPI003CEC9BA2